MSETILYVDDDPNILAAYRRSLRNRFVMETAEGGAEGLELIAEKGPFAVVVADMRMPEMDGVEFLSKVRHAAPDTVRMMLTGNADLQTAINAVNEGQIFRFLTKPCSNEDLTAAVDSAMQQHNLIISERQLLAETLHGAIKVLVEVLSLVNPIAFGRATRIRQHVTHILEAFDVSDKWKFEVAAMLSQIGCITLPAELIEKVYGTEPLTKDETDMYASHPDIGGRLIVNIPRLKPVAHIIARQADPYHWDKSDADAGDRDEVILGGHILRVVLDFDRMISRGMMNETAIGKLKEQSDEYAPHVVKALAKYYLKPGDSEARSVTVKELEPGMILEQDIQDSNGDLLMTKGQEINQSAIVRLRRHETSEGTDQPFQVLITDARALESTAEAKG